VLIAAGILLRPASVGGGDGLVSLAGPAIMLILYWLVWRSAFWAKPPHGAQAQKIISLFGLAAGFVFSFEILLEYAILPDTNMNIRLGWIEFGSVLALFAISAFSVTWITSSIPAGARVAAASAMVASLKWLTTLRLIAYAFWGTARQESVFWAEGDYEDFARSGMQDFGSFTLQDLRGATFFHLLIVPAVALLAGFGCAVIARNLRPFARNVIFRTI
jgi:hypothetical protein